MNKLLIIFLCLCLCLCGCTLTQNNIINKHNVEYGITNVLYYDTFIGKNIDSVSDTGIFSSTLEEMEYEGETWKIIRVKENGHNSMTFESNWQQKDIISRITILSPQIRLNNIFVGQKIKYIREEISTKEQNNPDGFLFFDLKKHNNIAIEIDMSNVSPNSPIWFENNIKHIPGDMVVKSIVISTHGEIQ